jgi:two-component system cell cycle response regulator
VRDNAEILIVEDSLPQAVRLRYILEHEGYRVSVAHNGLEALAALERSIPAIVISDVMMPEIDGYELCRRIKADARWAAIPIVLLTALSDPEDVFRALQAGVDNFITKPYENKSLLSNLSRILSNIELRQNFSAENMLEVCADAPPRVIEVFFAGRKYSLDVSRLQVVDLLLSTYESALRKNQELDQKNQQLKEALESIKSLQTNYRQLLETNVDAVVVVDRDRIVQYANPAANALFADAGQRLQGTTLPFNVVPGDRKEIELSRGSGEQVVAEMRVVQTDWDGRTGYLAVLRDITDHVRMREELRRLSLHDGLTGVYNRHGFCLIAEQMLKMAFRELRTMFLMFIDLDELKRINDTFGHPEGDAALCDIAGVLRATFRKSDIIGRLGGDEFAVLGFSDGEPLSPSPEERLQQHIDAYNATRAHAVRLSASIGVEYYSPDQPAELDTLIERADALMYAQKQSRQIIRMGV